MAKEVDIAEFKHEAKVFHSIWPIQSKPLYHNHVFSYIMMCWLKGNNPYLSFARSVLSMLRFAFIEK